MFTAKPNTFRTMLQEAVAQQGFKRERWEPTFGTWR